MSLWLIIHGPSGWLPGLLAATLGGVLAGWLAEGRPHHWNPLRLVGFSGFFVIESMRGGFDVARRTLHPRMPIRPDFLEYHVRLPAGQPETLLISVISLLPGTLSAEFYPGERRLVVHSLSATGRQSVARLERWIAWLYSLDPESQP
ncbi:MAG: Na+/H+ antiporter subunit E [Wenzhouxiangellaceae bacterium]